MSRRLTLADAQEDARKKGGECLSKIYKGYRYKHYKWRCKQKHEWRTSHFAIRNKKTWCPICYNKIRGIGLRKTPEEVIKEAEAINLKCLNPEEYKNNETKLLYQCAKGHKPFLAVPSSVMRGHGCHECSIIKKGASQRLNLEQVQEVTLRKGIILLSQFYYNNHTKLRYLCSKCWKEWSAIPMGVIKEDNTGCPYCHQHKNEKQCRHIFEEYFGVPFKKYYPLWLRTKKCSHPELDGYNPELKIAFEYNGKQHYEDHKFFHDNIRTLKRQKELDKLKIKRCKERGITLITIPYNTKNKKEFILKELTRSK